MGEGTTTDFTATRARFHLPDGVIYLNGNSLGPLPRAAPAAMERFLHDAWGGELIRGWNSRGWYVKPRALGDRIGRLIGAPAGSVIVGDTLSIQIMQALAAALDRVPDRRLILSDSGNFPTDLYMAEGLVRLRASGHRLRLVPPETLIDAIDDTVAVVLVTEVDYRTGRRHDMARLIDRAHARGAMVVWDLAHSAGAFPVNVAGLNADFAAGCTYKYLNGGPGAPAFLYVAPRLIDQLWPALSGWFGHAAPFAFETGFRPAPGIERMRIGTPAVAGMILLEAALEAWEGVDLAEVWAASVAMQARFLEGVERVAPELRLVSPRDPAHRGSQLSFAHPDGYAIVQALIARGVIGDFRAPDMLRFGFAPLYLRPEEVERAVDIVGEVMASRAYDTPAHRQRALVT